MAYCAGKCGRWLASGVRCGFCADRSAARDRREARRELRLVTRSERRRAGRPRVARSCLSCQADISDRDPRALRCVPCSRAHRLARWSDAANARRRAGVVVEARDLSGFDIVRRQAEALAEIRREGAAARAAGVFGVDAYVGLGSSLGGSGLVGGRRSI